MLTTVRLYGHLATDFGREFKLDIASPAEAIRALCHLVPGFKRRLADRSEPGYHVKVGSEYQEADDLCKESGGRVIRICPAIAGASGAAKIIIGVILIIVGIILIKFGGAYLIGLGIGMIVGGYFQIQDEKKMRRLAEEMEERRKRGWGRTKNYVFTGPVNATGQGAPVAVGYGRMLVGSHVVSGQVFEGYVAPSTAPQPAPPDSDFPDVHDDPSNDTVYDPGGETNEGSPDEADGPDNAEDDDDSSFSGHSTNDTDDEGSDDESEG